jgi:hypothetical protein
MEKGTFITLVGLKHYYGHKPYAVDRVVKIIKEPDNPHDSEAIRAVLPFIDTIGYVANSAHTVYGGTVSAGRLYDRIGEYAYAQILFITHSGAIALVRSPEDVEGDEDGDTSAPANQEEPGNHSTAENRRSAFQNRKNTQPIGFRE